MKRTLIFARDFKEIKDENSENRNRKFQRI